MLLGKSQGTPCAQYAEKRLTNICMNRQNLQKSFNMALAILYEWLYNN